MNIESPLKKSLAVVFGTVLALSSTPMISVAEDTTASTEETTAETETTTVSETDEEVSEEEIAEEKNETEWFKAELDEYDDSLSLISYESSPESANSSKKLKNVSPTPVELNVTGGYVGDIPWFESEPVIESVPGEFAVVTYGWGHGVGMSQNGANFYATYSGWTYQDILYHYYPGTYLMNTGLAYDEEITVNGVSGDVLSMVSQIVFNEVGGTMSYEAIKAQAVAVYTYCKYNGNDASDLRCKPCPPQVVVDAVAEVLGQALYYNDDYALTMFSASSGGITANCYEVFYSDLPYLRSVSSDYDTAYDPHYGTVTYIDDFQLRNMIQEAYGIELSDNPNNWIKPTYSDTTGYVTTVNIDDQITVKGYEFKLAIGLKSSKFNVYYTPRPDGEPIPDGVSEPKVVDPDYTYTPGVYYPNSYPTDIGLTYDDEDPEEPYEEPTDDYYEEPVDWYDYSTDYYEEPTDYYDYSYSDYDYSYSDYDYSYSDYDYSY
ncbi:MAG: sporulation protein [Ruminococcus sp.]|nr:sporulation protein [Ruminococcus sp.]